MDIKEDIKTLFREIEVYRSHSLFEEAQGKCQKLEKLIRGNDRIKNKKELLNIVAEKIRVLKEDARRVGEETASAQMSTREQDLVKKLFAVPKKGGDDLTAMEGAMALMVFGQFRKALGEFNELIKKGSLRVLAAKNIIRCHVGLCSLDVAVKQYEQWLSSGRFPPGEIENIRSFLQDILEKKGVRRVLAKQKQTPAVVVKIRPKPQDAGTVADQPLSKAQDPAVVADKPRPKPTEAEGLADRPRPVSQDTVVVPKEKLPDGEFLDILNIQLPIKAEPGEGEDIFLDVGYQRGNLISVIVPKESQVLVDRFQPGLRMDDVQFYSPSVVFRSSCVISDIKQIDSGPRRGGYALILKILSA